METGGDMALFVRIPLLMLLSGFSVITSVRAEPVKLAVLLPLSNVYKDAGNDAKRGLLLGIQEEVKAHKVPWDSWVKLEFFDTRVDKAHSLKMAKEVIADGAKAILGTYSSGDALYIQDYVLNEAEVPFILCAGAASERLRTTHPLFIRVTRTIPLVSISFARWLTAHPIVATGRPRWVCIHSDYAFGRGACEAFKRFYGEVGEEIGRIPVPLKTVNKKPYLVQLAKLKPDFAFGVFASAENNTFFQDYYRFKIHQSIPLLAGSVSAINPQQMQSYEKTLEKYGTGIGFMAVSPYVIEAANPINEHFVAQYQQAYNKPASYPAMTAYDTGRLLVKALVELQGKWDGAKVVQLMKTLPYRSPRHGQQLQFDSHSDVMNGAYIVKAKRDGNRLVLEIVGQVPPINMDEVLK
jgi:ABC-type branched-subunit amino acid transport system substrate-binding protein